MAISQYHQHYIDQSDGEIQRKADAKEQELIEILDKVPFSTDGDLVKIAVLGCGDKRLVAHHKKIFEKVLGKNTEIITFDISTGHLSGENNIIQHDCTLPLPNQPYDIAYGHVLLKFIETKKQFDVIKNSIDVLRPGGLAIHVLDRDELDAKNEKLPGGLWSVPLEKWKEKLKETNMIFTEINLKHGLALVIKK